MNAGFNLQFCYLLLTGIFWIIPPWAWALPAPEPDADFPGRIFIESSYFETKANYHVGGGNFSSLGAGRYYKLTEGRAGGEYFMAENVSAVAQMTYAYATSYDGTYSRNYGSISELLAGFRAINQLGRWNWMPQVWLSYPFNRFEDTTDTVLNGEGVMKVYAGLWNELSFSSLRPFAELGFLYQDDGRASYVLYELGLLWRPQIWRLGLKLYGSTVVIDDDLIDLRLQRDTVTTRVDGGSWKFNSVNPEILGAQVEVGVDLAHQFRLIGAYDQTLNGKSSAAGWTALLSLQYLFREPEVKLTPSHQGQNPDEAPLSAPLGAEKQFEPEAPKYDESLFSDPPAESSRPKVREKKLKPTVQSRPAAKRAKSQRRPTRPNIDNSLDEVQKSLEK